MATLNFICCSTHRSIFKKLNILKMIHKCTKVNSAIHSSGLIHMIWKEDNHEANQALSYKLFVLVIYAVHLVHAEGISSKRDVIHTVIFTSLWIGPMYEASANAGIILQRFALIGLSEGPVWRMTFYCLCLFTNVHNWSSWAWNLKYVCFIMHLIMYYTHSWMNQVIIE